MTSTIKVNNIQDSCGSSLVSKCGSTITLGASGKTVAIATGASTSGMGRTGTVDWVTTVQTSTITAANGSGYFVNTTGGAITMNLPAGSAGSIVAFKDYANTFNTNGLTVSPNGSDKIGGAAADALFVTESQSVTLVYIDSTKGWIDIHDSTTNAKGNDKILATGGTITTCGNYKIHTFTGPGTFAVTRVSPCAAENIVGYQVVAGGGAGGTAYYAGGGGAGGFREGRNAPVDNFTASPLVANAPTNAVTVSATPYPITVGGGGAASPVDTSPGGNGNNSVFSTITSAAGGGGGSRDCSSPGSPSGPVGGRKGADGGSGGGGTNYAPENFPGSKGAGNTPPVSPSQGNPGGGGGYGAGGGGATAAAADSPQSSPFGTVGGAGATSEITGSPVARAGGGGGGSNGTTNMSGGTGGGGAGTGNCGPGPATAGTANTGGGGGGGSSGPTGTYKLGGAGGSGIVIIRYKFQ